ncbi:macrophage mannose receptor 1 [Patella vulgata]|uniref:macrophage mannose receptor 1 n=1 Tax=Patella vulgata TaxID=6465 RepID=UPI00217F4278|nr:macrophage mannose receptor 1 [Patella vulgata]
MSYEGKISDEMCWQKLGYICSYALPSNGNCADGWLNSATKCYYISATDDSFNVLTWMDALGKCMTMVTGQTPTLVSFNSKQEYQLISQYLEVAQVRDMNWWIGLNDQNAEGNYVWTDGPADLSFMVWDKAPSKLALNEKCGVVHGNGKMSYGKCSKDLNYYICKLKLNNDNLMIYEELGCTGLWTRAGHKCYYFVPGKKVVRADARNKCQQSGGDLSKIESLDEMYWITLQTFTMEVNHVWTGLSRKSKGADSWSWADGSDINTEYIKWNQEPNDYLGTEDCAAISMDGVYNDMSCSNKAGFICQMTSVNRPCPSTWIMPDGEGSTCFYISDTDDNVTTTWDAAKDKCSQLAGGGDSTLFAPQSGEDYAFVTQQLMSRPPDPTGWWTDLTDSQVEGLWVYSTSYYGPPDRSLIVWRGEPNDFGGTEDCAVMYYGGRYNDVDCSAKSNILCEKPATPFPTTSNGNTLKAFQHVSLITTMFIVLIQQELLPICLVNDALQS